MKQKLLLKSMLLLFALIAGSSSVWADNEVTFSYADYKSYGTSGSGSEYTMTKTDVSITESKFYCGSSAAYAQLYAGGTITVTPSSGVTIKQIDITTTSTSYNGYQSSGTVLPSTGSCSANGTTVTWTGSATSAFTISHSKQIRWTSIVVTYTGGQGETETCATPTFSIASGPVLSGTTIALASTTTGAKVYYTMGANPANPTTSSTEYSDPIEITTATTIKAIAAKTGNNNSEVASASYTILDAPNPNPANVNSNYYTLVENVNDLADGDAILIVSGTKAMSTTQNDYNRGSVDVTVANNTIDNPTDVQKLILAKSGDYYFFYTGNGYLYAPSSSYNNLKTEADADQNAAATISISNNDATITFKGANTRNYMRFNSSNFACYATGSTTGDAVQIYKEVLKPANAKSAAQFSFPKATYYHPTGSAFTKPTLSTANGYDGIVTYSSSVESVATVDPATGAVTIVGAGTTVITAAADETEHFYADNTSYTLNVYEIEDGVFDFAKGNYGTGLDPGDTYYTNDATWTAGNITLKTTGNYRWYNSVNGTDLRLYGNDPYCTMVVSAPDGYVITKIDGLSSSLIASTGTISSSTWTGKSQSVTFTYENSGSGSITIKSLTVYYSEPTISVTLPEAGWMTYCNVGAALDFTGIKAYKVSAVGETSVTLEEITAAPANTPVILEATEGSHDLSVVASADAVGTNKLRVSDGTKTTTDTKIVYALAKKNSIVGFYKVQAGVNVPKGKCYIEVNAPTSAPDFLGFAGETTGVNDVRSKMSDVRGEVYNLAGQRVAQPTKGLYIVNGKKVVIK